LRRGFKSDCERRSAELRDVLGLAPEDPLPARTLSQHLGVLVVDVGDLPGVDQKDLTQLLVQDAESWSAFTIATGSVTIIVLNTAHIPSRQESDLMHEQAHTLLGHKPSQLVELPGLNVPLRTFDKVQEDEAGWFGACLQLPRPALELAMRRRWTDARISQEYRASFALVRYRRGVSGVEIQRSRWTRRRVSI